MGEFDGDELFEIRERLSATIINTQPRGPQPRLVTGEEGAVQNNPFELLLRTGASRSEYNNDGLMPGAVNQLTPDDLQIHPDALDAYVEYVHGSYEEFSLLDGASNTREAVHEALDEYLDPGLDAENGYVLSSMPVLSKDGYEGTVISTANRIVDDGDDPSRDDIYRFIQNNDVIRDANHAFRILQRTDQDLTFSADGLDGETAVIRLAEHALANDVDNHLVSDRTDTMSP